MAVYGGFAGTETARSQRNPAANVTILSGDIDNNDSQTPIITDSHVTGNTTNSYHVVTGATGATLDGFTITAGNANGTSPNDSGGGMYNSCQQSDVDERHLQRQLGEQRRRDVQQFRQQSDVDERHLQRQLGGTWQRRRDVQQFQQQSDVDERHLQRQLGADYGGGMYNSGGSNPQIRNTIFWGNTAASDGAQIYNNSAPPM